MYGLLGSHPLRLGKSAERSQRLNGLRRKDLRFLISGDYGGKPAPGLTNSEKGLRIWATRHALKEVPLDREAVEYGYLAGCLPASP